MKVQSDKVVETLESLSSGAVCLYAHRRGLMAEMVSHASKTAHRHKQNLNNKMARSRQIAKLLKVTWKFEACVSTSYLPIYRLPSVYGEAKA